MWRGAGGVTAITSNHSTYWLQKQEVEIESHHVQHEMILWLFMAWWKKGLLVTNLKWLLGALFMTSMYFYCISDKIAAQAAAIVLNCTYCYHQKHWVSPNQTAQEWKRIITSNLVRLNISQLLARGFQIWTASSVPRLLYWVSVHYFDRPGNWSGGIDQFTGSLVNQR